MNSHNELFARVILIKGAGEKASAVAHRLHKYGLTKIVMTDLPAPLAERRTVSFCDALIDGEKEVWGVTARKAEPSMESIYHLWTEEKIPVIGAPVTKILPVVKPDIFIDGVMSKRNTGTSMKDAPLVIALGPGFAAGKECHFAVETNPDSPHLGKVISDGEAEKNTGVPDRISGLALKRIIRSPCEGIVKSYKSLGDKVMEEEVIGNVEDSFIYAPTSGCIWGLVREGVYVKAGQKIGDIDPRGKRELCFEITAQARSIAQGALEAIHRFRANGTGV